jgi:hypothetical protein
MKSEEALEQIAYLKNLSEKAKINAAYGYPYFFLWGILCIIGYLHRLIFPFHTWKWVWLIISIIGAIMTAIILINRKKKSGYAPLLKKIGLQCIILLAADGLIFSLLLYHKIYILLNPYWAFQIGFIHIIVSVHMGLSFTFIGLWIIITAVAAYFMPLPFQHIWLAITFGGGLIFTGILFKFQIRKIESKIEK